MDEGQPEPQRHKRSFTQMSYSATLSPSPIGSIRPATFFPPPRSTPAPANDNLERRRTPHPHNSYLQPRASEEMSDRPQPQRRSRLEHRASQTIIDLTEEPEESPRLPPNGQSQNRSSRPPHLGRSDAVILRELIDLTADGVDDVIFTGERRLGPLPARPSAARAVPAAPVRAESPSLFVPARQQHAPPLNHRAFGGLAPRSYFGNFFGLLGDAQMDADPGMGPRSIQLQQDIMDRLDLAANPLQPMPQALNYQQAAFAEPKPEYVATPPAREGFTRSIEEGDILICPACEGELIQNNEVGEPVVKKSGKRLTKKEREEHSYWAIIECGHVYCNACFRDRASSAKTRFVESTSRCKKRKTFLCVVEDCDSDVKSKDKWVGIFT